MTIGTIQLIADLSVLGIPRWSIFEMDDRTYMPPVADWVLNDFSRWWRTKAAPALGLDVYTPETSDCDDGVDVHNALMRWAHRRMPEAKGTACPAGRLNFSLNPAGPDFRRHACAWVRSRDRGVIFVETQAIYSELKLTRAQLATATRCSP